MIKVYEVTNGYMGESYVKCFVIAENKKDAISKAFTKYCAYSKLCKKPDTYFNKLKATLLIDEKNFVSEIRDY